MQQEIDLGLFKENVLPKTTQFTMTRLSLSDSHERDFCFSGWKVHCQHINLVSLMGQLLGSQMEKFLIVSPHDTSQKATPWTLFFFYKGLIPFMKTLPLSPSYHQKSYLLTSYTVDQDFNGYFRRMSHPSVKRDHSQFGLILNSSVDNSAQQYRVDVMS